MFFCFVFWLHHGTCFCYNRDQKIWCKDPKIQDSYLRLLVKLYGFLAKRTNSTFTQVLLKRSFMSHTNQLPLFLSRMIQKMKLPGQKEKTAVIVGTICPYNNVCELCVSSHACSHILKAEGKILIFDQLAWSLPRRYRYFGKALGSPHSHINRSQRVKPSAGRKVSKWARNRYRR
ncbi:unnamed protein product [Nyctereutes procyonoides]|uniref:(raccoon dog) hypothetical protein n=1 Tax=Nyctereutes procyonoides TaxID=34880 RepID=A0A811YHA8_NYCPR|nr:unnamed protein product [Nyctereutes procyonoides]